MYRNCILLRLLIEQQHCRSVIHLIFTLGQSSKNCSTILLLYLRLFYNNRIPGIYWHVHTQILACIKSRHICNCANYVTTRRSQPPQYTHKKKRKLSLYIRKFRRDRVQSHIWLTPNGFLIYGEYLRISSYTVLVSPSSYMTLHPIPSEFPYICQCTVLTACISFSSKVLIRQLCDWQHSRRTLFHKVFRQLNKLVFFLRLGYKKSIQIMPFQSLPHQAYHLSV